MFKKLTIIISISLIIISSIYTASLSAESTGITETSIEGWGGAEQIQEGNDMEILRQRLVEDYISKGRHSTALNYLKTQDTDGKWSDVDYDNTARTNWLPLKHLSKVYDMAIGYSNPASKSYQSPEMLEGIKKGLQYWYTRKPTSLNWWQIQIGQQMKIGPVILILKDQLPSEIVEEGAKYLLDPTQVKASVTTGQNLVWFATETIQRGLLNYNEDDIKTGLDYIKKEIRITTSEGIQPDFSFYQHGAQLYNGGYGLGFIDDTCLWISLTQGTKFAFEKEKVDILSGLLLDGDRWMTRGKALDLSVQGREPSRKGNSDKAVKLLSACDILSKANPERSKEFEDLESSINGTGKPSGITGNKHFWRSDYMVHQREKFFASVKTVSSRTIGTELVNNENLQGFWLPFGLTYIMQRGDEYRDIYPVWDWARLPGVTAPYKVGTLKNTVTQDEKFVGGVSDGTFGAAVMSMDKLNTKAKKAWFFFNDEFVALGAGITSKDEAPVGTTLNQCLLSGSILVDGKETVQGESKIDGAKWILHDGIGYVFLSPQTVALKAGPQTGSWKSVNDQYVEESITKDVFTLWLDHGVQPKGASYQYIILPGADAASSADYSAKIPVNVISNTTDVQAVSHGSLDITGAVFYNPGSIDMQSGFKISVDKPCAVLIKGDESSLAITVSDPLAEASSITVTVSSETKSVRQVFEMPGEGMAGSSVIKSFELK